MPWIKGRINDLSSSRPQPRPRFDVSPPVCSIVRTSILISFRFYVRQCISKWALKQSNFSFVHSPPKSIAHISRGRRVKSRPFTQGFNTRLLGRPFGVQGFAEQERAIFPSISKAPPFVSPMNAIPRFSASRRASATFAPAPLRFASSMPWDRQVVWSHLSSRNSPNTPARQPLPPSKAHHSTLRKSRSLWRSAL